MARLLGAGSRILLATPGQNPTYSEVEAVRSWRLPMASETVEVSYFGNRGAVDVIDTYVSASLELTADLDTSESFIVGASALFPGDSVLFKAFLDYKGQGGSTEYYGGVVQAIERVRINAPATDAATWELSGPVSVSNYPVVDTSGQPNRTPSTITPLLGYNVTVSWKPSGGSTYSPILGGLETSIEAEGRRLDKTGYDSGREREYLVTNFSVRITGSGHWDSDETDFYQSGQTLPSFLPQTKGTIKVQLGSTYYIEMPGVLVNFTPSADAGGEIDYSYEFQGKGLPTNWLGRTFS